MVSTIAPDGSWLASGTMNGSIRIRDTQSGRTRTVLKHRPKIVALLRNPGKVVKAIKDVDTLVGTIESYVETVTALAVAPDGSWLAAVSGYRSIKMWDLGTGQLHTTLKSHTGEVAALAAAPDGQWLAAVGKDGVIHIWRTASWTSAAVMRLDYDARACSWLPHAEGLVVVGQGGMYVFDLVTGTIRQQT